MLLPAGVPSLLLGGVATPDGCWLSLAAGVSLVVGVVVEGAGCVLPPPEYGGTTAPVSSSEAASPLHAASKRTAALTTRGPTPDAQPNLWKTFPIDTLAATPVGQFT